MPKLKANLSYLRNLIMRDRPFYVYLYITSRCNLSCQMCFSANYLSQEKELDASEIKVLAGHLKKIGVGLVCLTGGEPLLRDDLPSIIRLFSEQRLVVHLQTNGFNVSAERIKEVIDAGCDGITVSLHSLNPQKNDFICGQTGAWQDVIRTLANITAELPKRGFLRTITTVVSRHNLEELPNLVNFATKIGFYIFLLPFHFSNFQRREKPEYFFTGKETSSWRIKPNDFKLVDSIYQKLLKMKKDGFNIYVSSRFLRESVNFLKYGNVPWKDKYLTCSFPGTLFFITVDGHFHICGFEKFNDVSLLDPDFPKIFYSRKFRDVIEGKVKECKGCMCAMAENFLLSKDLGALLEKIIIGIKWNCTKIKKLSYDEMLQIIDEVRFKDWEAIECCH